jgi:hypothetical protein
VRDAFGTPLQIITVTESTLPAHRFRQRQTNPWRGKPAGMTRPKFLLFPAVFLGALALGSLAAVAAAGGSGAARCQAEADAADEAQPGFLVLAGGEDTACPQRLKP